jgi:acyl-CoA thioester hydrolase
MNRKSRDLTADCGRAFEIADVSIGVNRAQSASVVDQTSAEHPSEIRFWIDQEVRFRDLDTLRHVNHTVYFVYAEMARLEYYREVLGLNLMDDLAFLILDIRCRYAAAAEYGDPVRVGFRIDWIKRSSSGFSYRIQGPANRLFAEGSGVQVHVDLETRRPLALPDALRARMLAFDSSIEERA